MKKKYLKQQISDLQYEKGLLESRNQGLIEQLTNLEDKDEELEVKNYELEKQIHETFLELMESKEVIVSHHKRLARALELDAENKKLKEQMNQLPPNPDDVLEDLRTESMGLEKADNTNEEIWFQIKKSLLVELYNLAFQMTEYEFDVEQAQKALFEIDRKINGPENQKPKTPLQPLEELRGTDKPKSERKATYQEYLFSIPPTSRQYAFDEDDFNKKQNSDRPFMVDNDDKPSEPGKGVLGESAKHQFDEFQKAFNGWMDKVHSPKRLAEILGLESTDINGTPV
jgi:hypothetical protein